MKPNDQLMKSNALQAQFLTTPQEPISTCTATKETVEILDVKYEKSYVAKIFKENCKHLKISEKNFDKSIT